MGTSTTHVVCHHQVRIFNTSFAYLFWLANNIKIKYNLQGTSWSRHFPKGGPGCIFCEYSEHVSREPPNSSLFMANIYFPEKKLNLRPIGMWSLDNPSVVSRMLYPAHIYWTYMLVSIDNEHEKYTFYWRFKCQLLFALSDIHTNFLFLTFRGPTFFLENYIRI